MTLCGDAKPSSWWLLGGLASARSTIPRVTCRGDENGDWRSAAVDARHHRSVHAPRLRRALDVRASCRARRRMASYGARCVMAIAVPVIVSVAVRSAPVLAATENWTVPSAVPDAP